MLEIKEFVGHKPVSVKEQSEKDQQNAVKKSTKKVTKKSTVPKKG